MKSFFDLFKRGKPQAGEPLLIHALNDADFFDTKLGRSLAAFKPQFVQMLGAERAEKILGMTIPEALNLIDLVMGEVKKVETITPEPKKAVTSLAADTSKKPLDAPAYRIDYKTLRDCAIAVFGELQVSQILACTISETAGFDLLSRKMWACSLIVPGLETKMHEFNARFGKLDAPTGRAYLDWKERQAKVDQFFQR